MLVNATLSPPFALAVYVPAITDGPTKKPLAPRSFEPAPSNDESYSSELTLRWKCGVEEHSMRIDAGRGRKMRRAIYDRVAKLSPI